MISTAEYLDRDGLGLAEGIRRGDFSPAEVLEAALARAAAVNPHINAIVIPMEAQARSRVQASLSGPFAGVPFLIKDIVQDYAGVPSTAGSRALRQWTPTVHATVTQRFLDSGVVIFGKTNTPELALKGVTEPEAWGPSRNPWDVQRTPGGSSGGAAAAVAAGIVPMAGANDGGGSIRIPAACCGLFGLRPSRGRVPAGPALGEVWEGASSDHVLTRSVRDSAAMLDAIQGAALGDPFQVRLPERPYLEEILREPGCLRIAFTTRSPIGTPVDPSCVQAVHDTVRLLEGLGHHVEEAEPAVDGHALARCYIGMYMGQVAASVDEIRAQTGASERDFELDTRTLALLGRSLSAGDYVALRRQWNGFARALGHFFQRYDLYLTPTVASLPVRVGELELPRAQRLVQQLIVAMHAGSLLLKSGLVDQLAREILAKVPFTQLSNLTGTPSMSVPLFWTQDPLPLGVHFMAPYGDEARLLRLAAQLEHAHPWAHRRPSLT